MDSKMQRALELKEMIRHYDDLYYEQGISEISDTEYDRLYKEYEQYEAQFPELAQMEDSPTRRVGAGTQANTTGLPKFTHKTPLLSIDRKAKEMSDLEDFYQKCGGDGTEVIIEPKFDGITCNINYEKGTFTNAATRGNGYIGDLITANFKNTDTKYPHTVDRDLYEVRGEAIIPYDFFKENLEEEYSNPRNAVSGLMRQINPEDVKGKGIQVIFYDVGTDSAKTYQDYSAGLFGEAVAITKDTENVDVIRDLGFCCAPYCLVNTFEDLKRVVETKLNGMIETVDGFHVLTGCKGVPHAVCDGLVIKVNQLSLRDEIGMSEKGPKWAFAYKFKPLQAKTNIRKVEWQVGKTGRVVPVAVFDEIGLGGTRITKATLNNYDYLTTLPLMSEKGDFLEDPTYPLSQSLCEGDAILVERSNDVIPRVVGLLREQAQPDFEKRFLVPDACPVCGGEIIQDGPLHFCTNPMCQAKMKKKLEHFASRNAMNIVGLGESIVDLFFDEGLLVDFASIYHLHEHREEMVKLEKFGDKKVDNLLENIERSKQVELDQFIFSLSIPNVGRATAKDIAKRYRTIEALLLCTKEELLGIEEIGDIMADGIYETVHNPQFVAQVEGLLAAGVAPKPLQSSSNEWEGKTFVITGTLAQPRDFYQKIIESKGGKCAGSVSKKTFAVLIGSDAGSKETKARQLVAQGVDILLLEGDAMVNDFLQIE